MIGGAGGRLCEEVIALLLPLLELRLYTDEAELSWWFRGGELALDAGGGVTVTLVLVGLC